MTPDRGPLERKLDITYDTISADRAIARMPVAGNTQPFGALHGGAIVALAESVASRAALTHALAHGQIAVGAELNVSYHRPAITGSVIAEARALKLGRRLTTHEVIVTRDSDGARLATVRVTTALVAKPVDR